MRHKTVVPSSSKYMHFRRGRPLNKCLVGDDIINWGCKTLCALHSPHPFRPQVLLPICAELYASQNGQHPRHILHGHLSFLGHSRCAGGSSPPHCAANPISADEKLATLPGFPFSRRSREDCCLAQQIRQKAQPKKSWRRFLKFNIGTTSTFTVLQLITPLILLTLPSPVNWSVKI